MRRTWTVLLMALLPAAAIAHFDVDGADEGAKVGNYKVALTRVDVSFDAEGATPPRGWVYGIAQVWIETHDAQDPTVTSFVYGPAKFSPGRRSSTGIVRDRFKIGPLVHRHRDCVPDEDVWVLTKATLLRKRSQVPEGLSAPDGRRLRPSQVAAVQNLLGKGRPLPSTAGEADLEDDGIGALTQRRNGRFTVRVMGEASYEATEALCGESGVPALEVRGIGFEHPSPPAEAPPWSAVCADVAWNDSTAAEVTARLQMETPDGWVDSGEPRTLTVPPGGTATAKFGITVADRNYRIAATGPNGLTATSEAVDVGPGTAGTGTRDCHPPG